MKHTAWGLSEISCKCILWQCAAFSMTDFWGQENWQVGTESESECGTTLNWVFWEEHWGCGCVVVWLCGDRKQQKSSSPPSHVEIKLSGSGAKFIFRIKDSSKKEPRRLGPHPQLLGPLPFCISINSFLSFSRCYIFKPSSASNLPFSGFLLHQCHDPILKESWTRPDAG